jgi:hypothetical protein
MLISPARLGGAIGETYCPVKQKFENIVGTFGAGCTKRCEISPDLGSEIVKVFFYDFPQKIRVQMD